MRIRGRVARVPAHRPLPAGDDRHRPGLHRRRDRGQPGAGAAGPGRRKDCSASTARVGCAPVPLRVGLDHQLRQRRVSRLRRRAACGRPTRGGSCWSTSGVQSDAAARRIKWALGQLAQLDLDVVVLARGGGSRADLAPFDTELVARAIAAMDVPVFTGVGHEVDRSVADEVAHTACKTPTACAQELVRQVDEFVGALDHASQRVAARARQRMAVAGRELDDAARRARRSATTAVVREHTRLDRAHGRLDELARRRTVDLGAQLDTCARRVAELGRRATRDRRVAVVGPRARARVPLAAPSRAGGDATRSQRSRRARARSAARARTRLLDHPRRRRPRAAGHRRARRRRAGRDRAGERTGHQPGRDDHPATQQDDSRRDAA